MRECTVALCSMNMEYMANEFKKGFTHPQAKKDALHPELLDCSDTIPASEGTPSTLVGKPKLGGHCYIKCKDGYKFAEYGEDIGVGSGWDDQGRLKITCDISYKWGHNGDFFGPIQWNVYSADCYLKEWGCESYPQCIPEDADP